MKKQCILYTNNYSNLKLFLCILRAIITVFCKVFCRFTDKTSHNFSVTRITISTYVIYIHISLKVRFNILICCF